MIAPSKLQLAFPDHNLWVDEFGRTFIVTNITYVQPFAMQAAMVAAGANMDAPQPEVQQHPANAEPQTIAPANLEEAPAPPQLPADVEIIRPREA